MSPEQERQFREFVAARSSALLRTAYLLTGDVHHAQDLLQTALLVTSLPKDEASQTVSFTAHRYDLATGAVTGRVGLSGLPAPVTLQLGSSADLTGPAERFGF